MSSLLSGVTRAVLTGQGASPQRLPSAHLTTLSFAISLGLYTALEISSPYPSSVTPHEELTLTLIPLLPQSLSPTVLAGQGAFPTLPPLLMKERMTLFCFVSSTTGVSCPLADLFKLV